MMKTCLIDFSKLKHISVSVTFIEINSSFRNIGGNICHVTLLYVTYA